MNYYTIHDILSYTDTDTKLIMNKVNKQYYVKIDTSDIYKTNSIRLTKYKINNNELNISRNNFIKVCRYCDKDIVQLMIDKGANDWNYGLYGACEGGNMDIVQLIINKGADDWNYGLCSACRGGHMDTVQLMINKGATECRWCNKSIEDHKK